MRSIQNEVTGILTFEGFREAGSATIDGKDVKWDAGHVISVLPLGEKARVQKYIILPDRVKEIVNQLTEVNWGTVITLYFTGKYVSGVTVVFDWADQLPVL